MCCRYYFDEPAKRELEELTGSEIKEWTAGDIHPSDGAWIILGKEQKLSAGRMKWGFPDAERKQLLINARAESALEKRTFSESVMRRRCIIPAVHFYEWDAKKNKSTFSLEDTSTMFMAGFYNLVDSENRFIILTTEANASMRQVHDRMPLILPKSRIEDWIHEDGMVKELLALDSPLLSRYQEYEQLSLF